MMMMMMMVLGGWAAGERLEMTHVARGVDAEGTLIVDVVMSGQLPQLPSPVQLHVLPYNEQYIQTGPGQSVRHLLGLLAAVRLD